MGDNKLRNQSQKQSWKFFHYVYLSKNIKSALLGDMEA
jgi:hypothetical protein